MPHTDALHPIILNNICTPCITAATGTELAAAYSSSTALFPSLRKGVYNPTTFFFHPAIAENSLLLPSVGVWPVSES